MMPDILNIPVPANLMEEKPASYTTFEAHTEKVKRDKEKEEEKAKQRAERRRSGGKRTQDSMEVLEAVPEGKQEQSGEKGDTDGQSAGKNEQNGQKTSDMEAQSAS